MLRPLRLAFQALALGDLPVQGGGALLDALFEEVVGVLQRLRGGFALRDVARDGQEAFGLPLAILDRGHQDVPPGQRRRAAGPIRTLQSAPAPRGPRPPRRRQPGTPRPPTRRPTRRRDTA